MLDTQIAEGEFTPLRSWLGQHVYRHGMRFPALQLVEKASGRKPESRAFVDYQREKLAG
jgi:carboxypeptidase Taq